MNRKIKLLYGKCPQCFKFNPMLTFGKKVNHEDTSFVGFKCDECGFEYYFTTQEEQGVINYEE